MTDPTPVTILFTQLGTAYTGDVFVRTQAEVDALRTSLTAGVTSIVGNVTIGPKSGTSDISDLSPLAAITEITGDVVVQRNPDLPNLMGLNQLQSIGGHFGVLRNRTLTSLGDFPALQSIGDFFGAKDNAVLTSLGNFPALQSIGGSFGAGDNASLTSLGSFPALQTIGGFFVVDNDALTSLGGFPMLASIGSDQDGVSITVKWNKRLQDCCVLTAFLREATNAVSGKVMINKNATGCSSTTEVNCDPFLQVGQKVVFATAKTAAEGTLEIFSRQRWQLSKPNTGAEWITNIAQTDGGNSDASSITGENDASITITTTANPNDAERSTTLTLRAIDQTGNALTDPAPITISFTQLGTTHRGDVSVTTQAEVDALRTSLTAGVTSIMGNVTIGPKSGTSDISDLSPFAAITEITGNVTVQRNPDLPDLMGLNQLQSIGGFFVVGKNAALTSLGDFTALQSIGGYFGVGKNAALTSLGDFTALQSIGGFFGIVENATLTSLGAFPMLTSIGIGSSDEIDSDLNGVSILVEGNDRLQDCCVLTAFLRDATNAVSGKVTIKKNATGCSSEAEIKPCAGE